MAAVELPYHLPPRIPIAGYDSLFVIGDSLSMGAESPDRNWPELLGHTLGLRVHRFAFGGARVETAIHNARRIDQDKTLVLLEIGGNDLFNNTQDFEAHLRQMLDTVCAGQRRVAMLELPLPPSYNRFGKAQRHLADCFGVSLIPKRYLARVLGTPGATNDGLHLSSYGHVILAETLAGMFNREE